MMWTGSAGWWGRQRAGSSRRLLCLGLLAVLLLMVGCAQQNAVRRGARLSEQGQYDEAIAEFEKAIQLAEDRHDRKAVQRYREKLEETRQLAAQFHHRNAELSFKRADLAAAQASMELCLKYRPLAPQYLSFRDRIERTIDDAEQKRAQALSLAEERRWQTAIARLEEAMRLHRTLPGAEDDLKRIRERAYQYYVGRAQERLRADDLVAVEAEVQSALAYRRDGSEAKDLLQTVESRRRAIELIARGEGLLQEAAYEQALDVLQQAQRLHPSRAGLSDLLAQARRGTCDAWIDQGRRALSEGQLSGALKLFGASQELLPGHGGIDTLIVETRSRLAERHLQMAQQTFADGYAGAAALHATVALGYEPTGFEAQRQLGLAMGQIQEQVQYEIGFAGFQAADEHQATASLLQAAALEHLVRTKPVNVVLVQRVEPAAGSGALLTGEVLESRVTSETKHTGQGESVYQDGYRLELNPDYAGAAAEVDVALRELEHARKVLAEAEARLARYERADPADAEALVRRRRAQADVDEARQRLVNAATRVGTAQVRVSSTPREVMVPNMLTHTYPIHTVTWTAQVHCIVKLIESATGQVLLAERIEGRHNESDRFVAADPARNVEEDPLELPDEARLLRVAANAMTGKLRQVLDTAVSKHGDRFVAQVRRAQAAGNATDAVDGCVLYLFAYPTRAGETDAMVSYLRRYLGPEDELIDLRRLLQTHCHILRR